jgi:hypothetical protein
MTAVRPVLQEQLAFGACSQIAAEPYQVNITRAILRNGTQTSSGAVIVNAKYKAPSMVLHVCFRAGGGDPLLLVIHDIKGVQLRSAARIAAVLSHTPRTV